MFIYIKYITTIYSNHSYITTITVIEYIYIIKINDCKTDFTYS